jgi:hypothetical protein
MGVEVAAAAAAADGRTMGCVAAQAVAQGPAQARSLALGQLRVQDAVQLSCRHAAQAGRAERTDTEREREAAVRAEHPEHSS